MCDGWLPYHGFSFVPGVFNLDSVGKNTTTGILFFKGNLPRKSVRSVYSVCSVCSVVPIVLYHRIHHIIFPSKFLFLIPYE